MNDIKIKWFTDETGKKYIISEGISKRIEIDEENKEIKNAKAFFREIIFHSFTNQWNRKIILVDDQENEVAEVKTIIDELIQLCNNELEANKIDG